MCAEDNFAKVTQFYESGTSFARMSLTIKTPAAVPLRVPQCFDASNFYKSICIPSSFLHFFKKVGVLALATLLIY